MAEPPRLKSPWLRFLTGAWLLVTLAVAVAWGARAYGRSIVFAFAINWVLIIGAIVFASTVVPLRLPARYYAVRPFEKTGRLYDLLGVRWYRRALRRVLWSANPAQLRSQPAFRAWMVERTKDAETGHLFIFLVITGITVWALASRWWDAAAWLLLFNLLHNGYPVLSMRQLRARLLAGPGQRHGRLQPEASV